MGMHYLIQGIFVAVGLTSVLSAAFDWDWFFRSSHTRFVVSNVGRPRARLFYAALGVLLIATGAYFFWQVYSLLHP
jgi:hypothetical protein